MKRPPKTRPPFLYFQLLFKVTKPASSSSDSSSSEDEKPAPKPTPKAAAVSAKPTPAKVHFTLCSSVIYVFIQVF